MSGAVKQDMEIEVPEEVFGVKKWQCKVLSNDNVATFIKELIIELPKGEDVDFKAGAIFKLKHQFTHFPIKNLMLQKNIMKIGTGLKFGM